MEWLEVKYVNLVSGRLRNFKRKNSNLFNFSCCFCGDSETNSRKARAYIYDKKGKMWFHCHNCNKTQTIPNFLKDIDQSLYNEFVLEKLKDQKTVHQLDLENFVSKMKPPKFIQSNVLKGLKKVSQLPSSDPVKKFVVKRKIPNPFHAKLFSCPEFFSYTNKLLPNKFDNKTLLFDETRLLIPFISQNNEVFAFQGRALGKSEVKYITIILDENIPKLYGMNSIDLNRLTFVFEGPIDSTFIPNSLATAGGDLVSSLSDMDKDNLIIVYDNEPRSRETKDKINKAIQQGYKVCIWPNYIEQKDINDMILAGLDADYIEYIIKNNSFVNLSASMALSKWSRV